MSGYLTMMENWAFILLVSVVVFAICIGAIVGALMMIYQALIEILHVLRDEMQQSSRYDEEDFWRA